MGLSADVRACDFCKRPVNNDRRTCCDRCLIHIGRMLWDEKHPPQRQS